MFKTHQLIKCLTVSGLALGCFMTSTLINQPKASASQNIIVLQPRKSATQHNSFNGPSKNQVVKKQMNSQNIMSRKQNHKFRKLMKVAKSKLGDRYVWGGNGPHTFDCSGFTKYVYRHALHKNLPRLAGDQYKYFHHVNCHHLNPGNLVFFGGSKHDISHVGMYIGKGQMIDAQLRGVVIENVKAPWWHLVGASRPTKL